MPDTEANLVFTRRNPEYIANESLWKRLNLAYSGGETYIKKALIRHLSELVLEFEERQDRAYYFNYVRRIPTRITEFILAQNPVRAVADEEIVADFDRYGNRVNSVMRQWEILTLLYGSSWMLVDSPPTELDEDGAPLKKDISQKKSEKLRPYGMALSPLCVTDWSYGKDGELDWVIVASTERVASDPYTEPELTNLRTLWTREYWQVFKQLDKQTAISVGDQVPHSLGAVPLIRRLKVETTAMDSKHWMEDVLRISDAILNNESECQINIVKQVFGLLVIPESFTQKQADIQPQSGTDVINKGETWGKALSRSFAVTEDEAENGITRYISPDGIITAAIESSNDRLKRELYDIIGLAVRDQTTQRESAESKAWDNQAVSAFLQTEADSLEEAEIKTWEMFNKWDSSIAVPEVNYNRDFNVQEFQASMLAITEILGMGVGEKFQKRAMQTALGLLDRIEKISPEDKAEIKKEIETLTLGSTIPME